MSGNTKIDVSYVAELARLELAPEEKVKLQEDMEEILGYIELLEKLDVKDIVPTAHAAPLRNIWREDKAGTPPGKDIMLENAPGLIDDELIKVPQVLPGEGMS
ncbi:MAG: hypothetical protein A2020_08965 [Lentisphaerae bacterium GWF2_45_14]|nr:MAG: hypothetical protein A2020_08965 [Lentisphaerae bacterium GWF2_45_14]